MGQAFLEDKPLPLISFNPVLQCLCMPPSNQAFTGQEGHYDSVI